MSEDYKRLGLHILRAPPSADDVASFNRFLSLLCAYRVKLAERRRDDISTTSSVAHRHRRSSNGKQIHKDKHNGQQRSHSRQPSQHQAKHIGQTTSENIKQSPWNE